MTEAEIAQENKKRKGLCMFVMNEAIEELTKHSRDLEKQISENQNTKKEIKELAHKKVEGVTQVNFEEVGNGFPGC